MVYMGERFDRMENFLGDPKSLASSSETMVIPQMYWDDREQIFTGGVLLLESINSLPCLGNSCFHQNL
uniref:Uncharacterized protein n=1 Tax=Lepeophtheirus salmonis TaxID=72036 RepID=A0A0K2TK99_LEPSM